ncbi:HlyD family type I secretion periplasmic adaptor subunit [Thioclava sp.]|uniref:HlyD family type I secretion periplasmic adaptor subunit n=1 Tax=Thioclava sp. TaxID=1933450 RepID=UPI003AA85B22
MSETHEKNSKAEQPTTQRPAQDTPTPVAPHTGPRLGYSPKGPIIAGFLTLAVLVGGFGLWSVNTQIAGAVIASGRVQVEENLQIVQHPDGGVVEKILVHDGSLVKAGDLLVELNGDQLNSERTIVENQYFELLARRGRLEAERANAPEILFPAELSESAVTNPHVAMQMKGQQELFDARLASLEKSLEQLEKQAEQISSQVDGVDAQLVALATQQELIARELTDQRSLLDRGLAQASRVSALERESADLAGRIGALVAQRAQAESRLSELEITRLRLQTQRREQAETELRDIGYRELELAEQRRALIGQIDRLDIRAPVSGIVHAMSVTTPRAVIRAAEPVLYLVPQDRPLVIDARIATTSIDEVTPGQPAAVRFPALSSRITPTLTGEISRISADVLTDQASGEPYYKIEVTLSAGELEKLDGKVLIPGMPAEVYLATAQRTPIAYLLKPFTDYFTRAFRET